MRRLLVILTILVCFATTASGANRLTTWSSGQVLTHTALNAEFDNIYIANVSRTAGYWGSNDNIPVDFGTSQDAQLEWDTVQTQDALWLGLSGSMHFVITDKADAATDYNISASTDPLLIIHSADATTAGDYIGLSHNQTDAVINAGAGGFSIQAAGTEITDVTSVGDWVFKGTTPTLTVGDAGAEDSAIVFDGNFVDFYIALDDTADDLIIGEGSTVGSNARITIEDVGDTIGLTGDTTITGLISVTGNTTLGDNVDDTITMTGSIQGTNALIFEGSSVDGVETIFAITDPTTSDKTVTFQDLTGTVALLSAGTQTGTMDLGTLDAATDIQLGGASINTGGTLSNVAYIDQANIFTADQEINGTTPQLTIGDGGTEDAIIQFDGSSATDYYVAYDYTAGYLAIGSGTTVGSNVLLSANSTGTVVTTTANTALGDAVTDNLTITAAVQGASAIYFDGATNDTVETILAITDPTVSDKTITLPNATGTVALLESANNWTGATHTFNGTDTQESLILSGNRSEMYVHVTNAFTNGTSGIKMTNDATYWTMAIATDDNLRFKLGSSNVFYLQSNANGGPTVAGDNFTINGVTYSWPAADGSAGQVLKTDGAGNLDWVAN